MVVSRSTFCAKFALYSTFQRKFTTCCPRYSFYEPERKGGYNKDLPRPSKWKLIKDGWNELGKEFKIFGEEVKDHFLTPPIINFIPGVVDKKFELRNPKHLERWVVTCDSDHGEGFSSCSLTIGNNGYGRFSGNLDTSVPKDGRIKRSGYCTIRTIRPRYSFGREAFHDWNQYTHFVIKVRGDGRTYMINLATAGYYDQTWNDMYNYPLYTRGGPYWQITKIPFSKFFFTSKGRIQDLQDPIEQDKITSVGFTCADKINGPFCLEIDYIGVEYDPAHEEKFAYEKYETPANIAAT